MDNSQHRPSRIKHPIYKGRSLEGTVILASLIGYQIDGIEHLTPDQQRELEVWAERTHLRASDNPVRVPPRPAWLPVEAWAGPHEGEGVWGGPGATPVDCAAIAAATGSTHE